MWIPLGFANPVGMIMTVWAFRIAENASIDRIESNERKLHFFQSKTTEKNGFNSNSCLSLSISLGSDHISVISVPQNIIICVYRRFWTRASSDEKTKCVLFFNFTYTRTLIVAVFDLIHNALLPWMWMCFFIFALFLPSSSSTSSWLIIKKVQSKKGALPCATFFFFAIILLVFCLHFCFYFQIKSLILHTVVLCVCVVAVLFTVYSISFHFISGGWYFLDMTVAAYLVHACAWCMQLAQPFATKQTRAQHC